MTERINSTHRRHGAMVCLVLSTENHFIEHREATVRQHGLRAHGRALEWASEKANAADGNAAQSATTTQARKGFRQLTQGVACRRLGGVSPLTVFRPGRSSADSHQLLDLCDVVKVLFVSEPVIYSSCDDNGYLLRSGKGTTSKKLDLSRGCARGVDGSDTDDTQSAGGVSKTGAQDALGKRGYQ